jgi:hypothetical protein
MSDPYKRNRRLGAWRISAHALAEYPGSLEEIQKHVVILDALREWRYDGHKFIGRSEHFDVVEEGEIIPLYRPILENEVFQRWERVEGEWA